jgi:hypothetical protein
MGGKYDMKFLALLKKELRECLPWIILAALVILLWAGLLLQSLAYRQANDWANKTFESRLTINMAHPPLQDTGVILFMTSIGLGLVLGLQQYWLPGFRGIWPFLLHRSISRKTLLIAKIAAGAIAFIISCGLIWTLLYFYSSRPGIFETPPAFKFYLEGWLLIFLGFAVYLATALSGLSTARWYTTKIFPLAFAFFVLLAVMGQWQLFWVIVITVIGMLIILAQMFDNFLNREF